MDSNQPSNDLPKDRVLPANVDIIVATHIWRDPVTHLHHALGIFNEISANHFPCTYPEMGVLIGVDGGHGVYQFICSLVFYSNDGIRQVLFSKPGGLQMIDPTTDAKVEVNIAGVLLPAPGTYAFEIEIDNELVASKKFRVKGSG